MGPWWVSQFDPSREVAEAAQYSFQVRKVDSNQFCIVSYMLWHAWAFVLSFSCIEGLNVNWRIEECSSSFKLTYCFSFVACISWRLDFVADLWYIVPPHSTIWRCGLTVQESSFCCVSLSSVWTSSLFDVLIARWDYGACRLRFQAGRGEWTHLFIVWKT